MAYRRIKFAVSELVVWRYQSCRKIRKVFSFHSFSVLYGHVSNVSVHMLQEDFSESLIQHSGIHLDSATHKWSPYQPGDPVDSIPNTPMKHVDRDECKSIMKSLVGSILWLSQGKMPYLCVITSILARYQNNPSPGHINAAKHAIKYLKGSTSLGISFNTT